MLFCISVISCVCGKVFLKYLPFENGTLQHEHIVLDVIHFSVTAGSLVTLPFIAAKLAVPAELNISPAHRASLLCKTESE